MLLAATAPVEVYTPLTLFQAIVIFIGIPVLVILIVVLLVSAPGWTRKGRHQPGQTWDADSLLLGTDTPADPAVTEAAASGPGTTGGSSAQW